MKLFGKKKVRAKTYKVKTAKQRAEELLERAWLKDLTEHPEYAREIARQRFAAFGETEGEVGEAPPDLLEVLRTAQEAKSLIAEELGGGEKTGGILQSLPEIMKALPAFVEGMRGLQGMIPQGTPQEAPPLEQLSEPTQEQKLIAFAGRFTSLSPEQAAQELYQNKDKEGDVRAIIWQTVVGNTADELFSMLPLIETMPQYQYLTPFAQKLSTNKGKQWVTLLVDEANRLNSAQNEGKNEEPMG